MFPRYLCSSVSWEQSIRQYVQRWGATAVRFGAEFAQAAESQVSDILEAHLRDAPNPSPLWPATKWRLLKGRLPGSRPKYFLVPKVG